MAIFALSTLLKGTRISNINNGTLDVGISSTYFYGRLLPSDKLACIPTLFFRKNGGMEEQVKKIISVMK